MDQQSVNLYLTTHAAYFPPDQMFALQQALLKANPATFARVRQVKLKEPDNMFWVSFFLGSLGVDRFMLGNTGMGILKLLTCGVCGILSLVDLINVKENTKVLNFNNVAWVLKHPSPMPVAPNHNSYQGNGNQFVPRQ